MGTMNPHHKSDCGYNPNGHLKEPDGLLPALVRIGFGISNILAPFGLFEKIDFCQVRPYCYRCHQNAEPKKQDCHGCACVA